MSDKKHIDRLFQESFKDFEATPSDAVWENIEEQLNLKKKKRRVIPIWWRYAGVAAFLLLLITIGFNYSNNDVEQPQTHQIVDTENSNTKETSTQQYENPNTLKQLNTSTEGINNISNVKNDSNNLDEAIADNNTEHVNNEKTTNQNKGFLNNKAKSSEKHSITEIATSINPNESKRNRYLSSNKESNNSKLTEENLSIASTHLDEENNNSKTENKSLFDKNKAKKIIENTSKSSTVIAENKTSNIDKNTLTIEEALNNNTVDVTEKQKLSNRWRIAPNAAPVYFNTLGEGSSIDPQFNSNSKTGDLNMSYGLSASYAVNKKLSVRTGINKLNLGYNTNNVVVFQSVGVSSNSSSLQNVSVSSGNSEADALTTTNTESVSIISGENLTQDSAPASFGTNTTINQSFSYIEVPFEIQYALTNKKFGVNVIGGFSSFFLDENKIFSDADSGQRTFLGEATNINKVSYSANFGLGLNYQMSKKIDFNFEPMFKYQINTFNNTSGDFKPFFLGVYTGFAIKF